MRILHHNFDGNAADQVAFGSEGRHFVCLRKGGTHITGHVQAPALSGGESEYLEYLDLIATSEYGFSRVGSRRFLNQDGIWSHEALFANIAAGTIERLGMLGKEEPIPMGIDMSSANVISASRDGRYVAAGDGDGRFEIWNLDLRLPHRVFGDELGELGTIADIAFSKSNLDVMVSTTSGGMYRVDAHRQDVVPLHSEDFRWPCYSIDWQPEGDAIAFAGEGPVIWLVGLPKRLRHQSNLSEQPFATTQGMTFTGVQYDYIAGMPGMSLCALRTGVGSYVHQVRFLSDSLVGVLGPECTEVWQLDSERPQLIAHRQHDVDTRLFSFGYADECIRVALGKRRCD